MIAIIDYGMGNIHSVQKALQNLGAQTIVSNTPEEIKNCQKIVLPGVGAFDDAMLELEKRGLSEAIRQEVKNKKPFLGICLGMQILFEKSDEGSQKGLGILSGQVRKFPEKKGFKVPHMGWNQLKIKNSGSTECPLLKDIKDGSYVYFCHSYYPVPNEKGAAAATTDYINEFASIVWQDNLFGAQFHPEKSQQAGLTILKNFIEL